VLWQLDGVQYRYWDDYASQFATGTMSGSFVYDAEADTYSNVHIVGQLSGIFGGGPYEVAYTDDFELPGYYERSAPDDLRFVGYRYDEEESIINGAPVYDPLVLKMTLDAALTDAAGTVGITPAIFDFDGWVYQGSGEFGCYTDGFCFSDANYNGITSGQLVGTVIPVPAALWLFLSGLGLLGVRFRRQV